MRVDLHNHTYLSKHAVGTMEDYVKRAIEKKIDVFGFSDHNPMHFDKKHRMEDKYKIDYFTMFEETKKQFSKEIKLLLGFEFDYLENGMNEDLLKEDVDYLIGAVHFIKDLPVDNHTMILAYKEKKDIFKNKDSTSLWTDYFDLIKKMANSGFFNIVGHLDLIKLLTQEEPKKDIRIIAKEALKAIKKSGMSVEINSSGLRKSVQEIYPSKKLLEEIFSLDIPITFGSDAHSVEEVGFKAQYCENLAKELGFRKCVYYEKKEKILVDF